VGTVENVKASLATLAVPPSLHHQDALPPLQMEMPGSSKRQRSAFFVAVSDAMIALTPRFLWPTKCEFLVP
jgi:hypothetical protein